MSADFIEKYMIDVVDGFPFEFDSDTLKLFYGTYGDYHSNIHKSSINKSYPGRIWVDKKIISFWVYPSKSIMTTLIKIIEKELDIQIFYNNWEIEVFLKNDTGGINYIDTNSDHQYNLYSNSNNVGEYKVIPIEEYVGSQVNIKDYTLHLMKSKKKTNTLKNRGYKQKDKSKTMTNVEYNYHKTKYKYTENKIYNFIKFTKTYG